MALEVGLRWPLRSASDDLWGRPQMTSILLSARDEKFGRNSLYGLWGRYMAFEVIIWPLRSLYGGQYMALRWPQRSASDNLNIAKCPWWKVWTKFIIWPLRSLYGLWGRYMEVTIWPWRSIYGLEGQYMALKVNIWPRGQPQMTSSVLKWPQYCYVSINTVKYR